MVERRPAVARLDPAVRAELVRSWGPYEEYAESLIR